MATPRARIDADTDPALIAERLRTVADYLDRGRQAIKGMSAPGMLTVLEGIADVIAAAAPHAPLRELRQDLYKALLAADVSRQEIARAAGVSVPAIGFSIGSERRAANGPGTTKGKKRRPRPQ